jgi:hypothetical protein
VPSPRVNDEVIASCLAKLGGANTSQLTRSSHPARGRALVGLSRRNPTLVYFVADRIRTRVFHSEPELALASAPNL